MEVGEFTGESKKIISKGMKRTYKWGWMVLLCAGLSCHQSERAGDHSPDTLTSGRIRISVDESFRPIMEEEIKVFISSNPDARIVASYKPEAECLKDLESDSTRMIFVTRGLTRNEEDYYQAKLKFNVQFDVLAYDAIAVILNRASTDSSFTREDIGDILRGKDPGKFSKPYTAVFDGLNATSTIRFALDSILRGGAFDPARVYATENSTGVINYVATHPQAMGFVGVDWIGNPEDSAQDALREKVRISAVMCDQCPGKPYVEPSQEEISTGRYPFVRGLYYINKENYDGLGTGFVNFLRYQRGQLIFRRAYLVPAILPFIVRNAKVQ
jgi:phosphate transport system substrate-binding protein